MITVGMNYKVVPGKDGEFVAVFTKVLKVMADMQGHAKTNLYRDVYAEHDYLIVSEWTDEAAFNAFIQSDRFKSVTTWGRDNVLTARPRHEIYGGGQTTSQTGEAACPAHGT